MKSGRERDRSSANLERKEAGRPSCLDREKTSRLLEAYFSEPYSLRQLAGMFGVSRMTVWRLVQRYEPAGCAL